MTFFVKGEAAETRHPSADRLVKQSLPAAIAGGPACKNPVTDLHSAIPSFFEKRFALHRGERLDLTAREKVQDNTIENFVDLPLLLYANPMR